MRTHKRESEDRVFVRKTCTDEPTMKIACREFIEEEKKPTCMRKRKARRSKDRVFLLMDERKSTRIGLTNPTIREEGSSQIKSDQDVFN